MNNNNARAEDRELNILVVDDSAMMRTMIKRVVEICDLPGSPCEIGFRRNDVLRMKTTKY
jgi:hypothetical protein